MRETVSSLCCKVDELAAEISFSLNALSIIQEAMTEHCPKAERFSNAICSVYLNLCNLTEQLDDLIDQTMKGKVNAEL